MKKWILLLTALLIIILIAIVGIVVSRQGQRSQNPAPGGNPFGTGTVSGTTPGTGTDVLPLTLSDGTSVSVPDFTKQDQPSWAGPTGYEVGGSPDTDFLITYIPPDSTGARAQFLIALQKEPLGAARTEAENELRTKLGLTNDQLCKLDVQVRTAPGLNDAYADKLLGLSFCPGSVPLPQ